MVGELDEGARGLVFALMFKRGRFQFFTKNFGMSANFFSVCDFKTEILNGVTVNYRVIRCIVFGIIISWFFFMFNVDVCAAEPHGFPG